MKDRVIKIVLPPAPSWPMGLRLYWKGRGRFTGRYFLDDAKHYGSKRAAKIARAKVRKIVSKNGAEWIAGGRLSIVVLVKSRKDAASMASDIVIGTVQRKGERT
jgi:hypothetical protein